MKLSAGWEVVAVSFISSASQKNVLLRWLHVSVYQIMSARCWFRLGA